MVGQIYPTKLQRILLIYRSPIFELGLVHNEWQSLSNIYDKRDDFNFEIVNFPFLMEMFRAPLRIVYMFRNLFVLHECVLMLMTSTIETYF